MSWSTRMTSAPNCAGDPLDHLAELARLLVRKPCGRLVEQDDARVADDGARDLDEPPLVRAERADLRLRRPLEADELHRAQHVGAPRRALRARVLVDHRDVVVDRELLDRHLGLERPPEPPARAPEVGHRAACSRRSALIVPAAGLTKPLSTLKNVVLPAPFGPISPHVPPGKTTLMSSIGVTPANRTVRPLTSITTPSSLRRRAGVRRARRGRPSFAMSRGN